MMSENGEIRESHTVDRYDGTNFLLWKMHMRFIFQSREMFSIVNGTLTKDSLTDPAEQLQWEKKDKQAIVAILGTLDSFHKQEVITCSTSHEMWTQLQAYHDQHSDQCIIALQAKYYNLKLNEGESIAVFISTLQQLAKQLTELGQTVTEQQLISKIICGLPSSFDPLLLAWDNVPLTSQSLLGLQSRLIKLQNKLRDRAQQVEPSSDRAFFTKSGSSSVPASRPSPTVDQKKAHADKLARHKRHSRCYQCGQRGHFGKDCPNDTSTSDDDESKRLSHPRSSRRPPHQSSRKGKKSQAHVIASSITSDIASDYSSASSEAYCVNTSTDNSSSHAEDTFWFADSGATEHMTDKLQWFTNFQSIDDKCWTVTIANNNILYVRGIGDIPVHATINGVVTSFRLKNVLYVPQLRRNLISTGRLTEKRAAIVHIRDQCKIITDDGNGHLLMIGSKFNGLWRLHIEASKSQSSANIVDTTSPSVATRLLQKWHSRLGHVNFRTLHQMSTQERVNGIPALCTTASPLCTGCIHGKHHRGVFPVNSERKRVSAPGSFFHCDISGPFQVLSHGGHSYFMTFKDDHSSFRFVFFMVDRSEVFSKFKILYKLAKKETGHSMTKLRTDNGREFLSKEFQAFIQLKGIRHELTAPYTPEQNSVIERDNRSVVECARSMLHNYSMPLQFWGEAINTAVYVLNRVSSRTLHGDTPYTKWYGVKPDVSYFRVFGSLCYAHVPKPLRRKLDSKARECIFVGYCLTSKAYRLWCPKKKKILIARDVIFDEETSSHFSPPTSSSSSSSFLPNYSLIFPLTSAASQNSFSVNTDTSHSSLGVSSGSASSPGVLSSSSSVGATPDMSKGDTSVHNTTVGGLFSNVSGDPVSFSSSDTSCLPDSFSVENSPSLVSQPDRQNSSHTSPSSIADDLHPVLRTRALDDLYSDTVPVHSSSFVAHTKKSSSSRVSPLPPEPQTYHQAIQSEHKQEWQAAMLEEIESLLKNETWTFESLPAGRNTVKNKWVFRIKVKSDGTIERFKARLVAKGFTQTHGMDYTETFAPTARAESIRIILSIVGAEGLFMIQFDIKTAYLNSTLTEIIYMDLPVGFEDYFHKRFPGCRGQVCRILKGLYGLKQSARGWNKTFSDFLKEYELIQSTADPCIFYSTKAPRLILALWVDDGLVLCSDQVLLRKLISHLQTKFEVTVGDADVYVGLHITRDLPNHRLFVDQQRFTETLLVKYGYQNVHTVCTPSDPHVHLSSPLPDDCDSTIPDFPYQEIVGSLLYLATHTRPDIAQAVSVVAQYATNFREIHCTAVKRILKYLRGTTDFALCYSSVSTGNQVLLAYTDADYAGDLNDRKSRSGSLLLLNNGPVLWLSRKQPCTATSTTESEYVAASLTSKEVVWARRLLNDLGFPQPKPTPLFSDNQSAIRLVQNPEFHKRTKHIDVVYHLIREIQARGEITICYVPTRLQLADILTKALTPELFQKLRAALNLGEKVPSQVGVSNAICN